MFDETSGGSNQEINREIEFNPEIEEALNIGLRHLREAYGPDNQEPVDLFERLLREKLQQIVETDSKKIPSIFIDLELNSLLDESRRPTTHYFPVNTICKLNYDKPQEEQRQQFLLEALKRELNLLASIFVALQGTPYIRHIVSDFR